MENHVSVWRLNDYEWWAGYSLQHCIDGAVAYTGVPVDEMYDDSYGDMPVDLDVMKFKNEDGTITSFREVLDIDIAEGKSLPYLFAATDY